MGGPEAPSGVQRDRARRRSVLASIAAGGALGTLARYLLASVVHRSPGSFPWATFWTNVTGSFVLGLVLVLILERFPPTRYLRAFIATGFCGAFTTFSTLAVETELLVRSGHAAVALTYAGVSLAAGLVAVWMGMVSGRLVPAAERLAPLLLRRRSRRR
ncbi:MAG TPA: fluoride efflux transporter CrcB [Acidimicrobiales bacterium]|nr:fluoride efflux transporter CrcB [Acidimicrobiales bacterium]